MEKHPSASQQIARILWSPSFHHRVHKSLTLLPIPVQTCPYQAFPNYSLKKFAVIVLINEAASTASAETLWLFNNRNKYVYKQFIKAAG
jgi:hypothetical protein